MSLSRRCRILLFLIYAFIITVLSLLPADHGPSLNIWDKLKHFCAYSVFMVLAFPLFTSHRWRLASGFGIILYSSLVEYAQQLAPGRHTSIEDIFANSLGVATGFLIAWLTMYIATRKNPSPP